MAAMRLHRAAEGSASAFTSIDWQSSMNYDFAFPAGTWPTGT